MPLSQPTNEVDKPQIGETYYFAKVVNNEDPEKAGRIRVRVSELHGDSSQIPDDKLPWAMILRPIDFGSGDDISSFIVPTVGSTVVVIFSKGDIYSPICIGSPLHQKSKLSFQETNYPNRYGFKDPNGNNWYIDMKDNTLNILYQGDVTTLIKAKGDKQGNVSISIDGDVNLSVGGDCISNISGQLNATVNGNISFTSSGEVSMTSPSKITLEAPLITLEGTAQSLGGFTDLYNINSVTIGDMRDIFNTHTHNESIGSVTNTPNQTM